jgi:cytochrome c peroxidase
MSGSSPYDRFVKGDRAALTAQQQAGLRIFRGKGNCSACHIGPNFTDERLHNTGVAWRPSTSSGHETGSFADAGAGNGAFKTPTLREIARTAPYMHDGSLTTLKDVVDFYDGGGRDNRSLDPELRPLGLTELEKQTLVMFLGSLSGTMTR